MERCKCMSVRRAPSTPSVTERPEGRRSQSILTMCVLHSFIAKHSPTMIKLNIASCVVYFEIISCSGMVTLHQTNWVLPKQQKRNKWWFLWRLFGIDIEDGLQVITRMQFLLKATFWHFTSRLAHQKPKTILHVAKIYSHKHISGRATLFFVEGYTFCPTQFLSFI